RRPESPAVITSSRTFTYGEIDRASLALARRLRQSGARPGSLVAVVMDKGWQQVVAVLATLRAGAAYLPIDASLPAERIRHPLTRGEASIALIVAGTSAGWSGSVASVPVGEELFVESPQEALDPLQGPADIAYVIFTSGSTGEPKGVVIDHRGALNTVAD